MTFVIPSRKILFGMIIFLTLISEVNAQTWVLTGNMAEQRARHSAVLLYDGRVLVLGSAGHAELYDPGTRTFTPTGTMNTTGYEATATRLLDCRVLVVGGNAGTGTGGNGAVDQVTAALTTSFPFTTAGTFHPSVTVMENSGATVTAATTVTIATTTQAINDLITSIQGLSSLNTEQKNSLISKLNAVSDAINRANLTTACNQLGAFINEVTAQLDQATANNLIDVAQSMKTAIECS